MHQVIPSVNVFVKSGNKILLSRRANTGWQDGMLCAVGGHVEEGESPTDAMIREIKEELGVDVDLADMEFLCVAARNKNDGGSEYVAYEFIIVDKDYEYANAEPEKCSELVWVDLNNLPDDIVSDFRVIIEQSIIGNRRFVQINY